MLETEFIPELVEYRRQYLRSLARRGPVETGAGPVRRRIGQLLVRFGCWLEGRCPEMIREPAAPATWHSA